MRVGTVTDRFAASKADYEGGDYSPAVRGSMSIKIGRVTSRGPASARSSLE